MTFEIPSYYFWLIWILPFIGCLVTTMMGKLGRARDYTAVLFSLASAVFSFLVLLPILEGQMSYTVVNSVIPTSLPWISSLGQNMGVLTDPYTIIISNIVSWIGFLILVYSLDYMRGEKGLTRYWFFMNFFLGAMQLIVLSNNLLSLFIGWEGVGLASYALIGFYYKDRTQYWVGTLGDRALGEEQAYSPSHAGMKAFVMTRIGDMAFLAGIFILFYYAKTFSFQALATSPTNSVNSIPTWLLVPVAVLIFGGAVGKSAQFPLHEWLPDAMAGPAPVSALIHAATMVNAGVILVARIGPIFYFALLSHPGLIQPFFLTVAWIGGFTAFLAATQGMVGYELKKILAYSTASQIGYMILALGLTGLGATANFAEGLSAGLFHLMSQAIFKACLFMAAGVLIHTTGSKYICDMGSLKNKMKLTFAVVLMAAAALSGIPPFSGFWSKDAILTTAWNAGQYGLFAIGVVTAGITAFYTFRMFGIIFYGDRSEHLKELEEGTLVAYPHGEVPLNPLQHRAGHEIAPSETERVEVEHKQEEKGHAPHEPSPLAWVPYSILGVMCVVIGIASFPFILNIGGVMESAATTYLTGLFPGVAATTPPNPPFNWLTVGISVAFVAAGVFSAWALYIGRWSRPENFVKPTGFMRGLYKFIENRWYINAIYYRVFVDPTIEIAQWTVNNIEDKVLSKINVGGVLGGIDLSKGGNRLDSIVNAAAGAVAIVGQSFSRAARKMQSGILEKYTLIFTIGIIIILVIFLLFSGVKLP
jgi:NADH-quinone oxidoreductase subunit L